jgi:hypothetical protein
MLREKSLGFARHEAIFSAESETRKTMKMKRKMKETVTTMIGTTVRKLAKVIRCACAVLVRGE